VSDPAAYTAVFPISRATVQHIAAPPIPPPPEHRDLHRRKDAGNLRHAVLICRFLFDATQVAPCSRQRDGYLDRLPLRPQSP
jgi:hypothetical protein